MVLDLERSQGQALFGFVRRLGIPQWQRHVLYLRCRADLSFEQIGIVMSITSSAARSHALAQA